ncbi:MAG: cytidine deaminase [Fimbriimonadaceae bacterium]
MSDLLAAAIAARSQAYAPYSGYAVGAALLDEQGRIHVGCNVENVSYGLTICAERSAVARMIAEGGIRIREIALVTKDGGTPCGACLQVLLEFAEKPEELLVRIAGADGETRTCTLRDLLPQGFSSTEVRRTAPGRL